MKRGTKFATKTIEAELKSAIYRGDEKGVVQLFKKYKFDNEFLYNMKCKSVKFKKIYTNYIFLYQTLSEEYIVKYLEERYLYINIKSLLTQEISYEILSEFRHMLFPDMEHIILYVTLHVTKPKVLHLLWFHAVDREKMVSNKIFWNLILDVSDYLNVKPKLIFNDDIISFLADKDQKDLVIKKYRIDNTLNIFYI